MVLSIRGIIFTVLGLHASISYGIASSTSASTLTVTSAAKISSVKPSTAATAATAASNSTTSSNTSVVKQDNGLAADFEGYTSAFNTWSPIYCSSGSTYKTFVTSEGLADCCPTSGNCKPATECYGNLVFHKGSPPETCQGNCATGLVYQTSGDPSPMSMYGCFDPFKLYRILGANATTTTNASAPAASSSTLTHPNSSLSAGVIAAVVIGGIVVLLTFVGLVIYILILRKRQLNQPPSTELQYVNKDGSSSKAELPAYDLPSAHSPSEQSPVARSSVFSAFSFQQDTATVNSFELPAQYPWPAPTPAPAPTTTKTKDFSPHMAVELPAELFRGHQGRYHELSG